MPWNFRPNSSGRSVYRDFAVSLARQFWSCESPWPDYRNITPSQLGQDLYSALRIDYEAGLTELQLSIDQFLSEWQPNWDDDGIHYFVNPASNLSFAEYDAFILHCMLRRFQPRKVIELGSGMSTRVIAETQSVQEIPCEITCVDRYPTPATKETLSQLGVNFLEENIVHLSPSMFESLEVGDILFIDSSHVLKNFGDVEFEFMAILPRLKPGVVVHVHDIFLPFNYPLKWIVDWRCVLTEQQVLGAFLHDNARVRVLSANHYNLRNQVCVPESMIDGSGGSFWFEVLD